MQAVGHFGEDALSHDGFLGGRLQIYQPKCGYRAGIDPVLLAAAIPARKGQHVLELGCGGGVASLCLGQRVPGLVLAGLELQASYADLAKRNARGNGVKLEVYHGDIRALPPALRARGFDHVLANPPYFRSTAVSGAKDEGRRIAQAGTLPLSIWADVATRRLVPGGYVTFIQKADRLSELLAGFDARMGGVRILPVAARAGRVADLVILQARKGSRAALRLLPPLVLHEGERHEKDGESFTPRVSAILRDGAALKL